MTTRRQGVTSRVDDFTTGSADRKAAIYVRVSTDIQTDNTSLGNQEEKCKQWCRSYNYTIYNVYRDEGISGAKSEERAAFQALLADAEAGKFEIVVCSHLDRFARSLQVLIETVNRFKRCGVRFACAEQHIDTSQEPFGTVFLQLLGVFAEWERSIIAERTKSGKVCEIRQGRFIGGQMPLGFENTRDGGVAINELEAEVVKQIFDLAQNNGTLTIARLLNKKQIPHYRTKIHFPNRSRYCKRYERRRNSQYCKVSRAWADFDLCEACVEEYGGQPEVLPAWHNSVVRKILHNSKYMGKVTWGHDVEGFNASLSIISQERFEQVQRRMEQFAQKPSRAKKSPHLLTGGLLKCFCGANFICLRKRDDYWYQCAARRNKKTCNQRMFRRDNLDSEVINTVQHFIAEHDIDLTGTASQTEQYRRKREIESNIEFCKRALKTQEERLKRIAEQAISCRQENRHALLGLLEKQAQDASRQLTLGREALTSLEAGLKLEADEDYEEMLHKLTSSDGNQLDFLLRHCFNSEADTDLRKNLLSSFVKRIVVDEQGQLTFVWQDQNFAYITS